jgi:hypothetical protein
MFPGLGSRAIFSFSILGINGLCTKEQMIGIDAHGVVATMKNAKIIRNRTVIYLPGFSVGKNISIVVSESPVPILVKYACPIPANVEIFSAVNSGPEPIFASSDTGVLGIVPVNKAPGLAFDYPGAFFCARGNSSLLAAATHAETAWIWAERSIMELHRKFTFLMSCLGTFRDVAEALSIGYYSSNYTTKMGWGTC